MEKGGLQLAELTTEAPWRRPKRLFGRERRGSGLSGPSNTSSSGATILARRTWRRLLDRSAGYRSSWTSRRLLRVADAATATRFDGCFFTTTTTSSGRRSIIGQKRRAAMSRRWRFFRRRTFGCRRDLWQHIGGVVSGTRKEVPNS